MNKKETLYFISGLSFIPVIGIIFSIPLLLLTFIKKQDIIFLKLSVTSILFHVMIIAIPFLYLNSLINNDEPVIEEIVSDIASDDITIETSQNQLTYIFEEIELYKINNKRYPENLYELRKSKSKGILIFDMIQSGWFSENKKALYYYKLINSDSYRLFSKGVDGIAFTKDDLYPVVSKNLKQVGLKQPD